MHVRDLMTTPVEAVSPDTSVARCLETMRSRAFRTLPVVDADRRPLGLLYEARAAAAPPDAPAKDAMTDAIITCRPGEPVYDVLNRCTWAMQDAALVVEDGVLVGILTEYDAVKQAAALLPADLRVEDHASTSLMCIDAQRPAREAFERMQRGWVKDMVVLDGRRLLGILSQRECIAARVLEDGVVLAGALVATDRALRGCVQWDTPLRDAAQIAVDENVGCVPVVSDDGQLRVEAVVSRGDIVRALLASGAVGEADLSVEGPPQ